MGAVTERINEMTAVTDCDWQASKGKRTPVYNRENLVATALLLGIEARCSYLLSVLLS